MWGGIPLFTVLSIMCLRCFFNHNIGHCFIYIAVALKFDILHQNRSLLLFNSTYHFFLLQAHKNTDNAGRLPGRREIHPVPKKKKRVKLEDAAGMICAGSIIPYPPGIPLICPGEKMDAADLAYVAELRERGEKVIGINELGEVTVGA